MARLLIGLDPEGTLLVFEHQMIWPNKEHRARCLVAKGEE
jgi:hypothetical protein